MRGDEMTEIKAGGQLADPSNLPQRLAGILRNRPQNAGERQAAAREFARLWREEYPVGPDLAGAQLGRYFAMSTRWGEDRKREAVNELAAEQQHAMTTGSVRTIEVPQRPAESPAEVAEDPHADLTVGPIADPQPSADSAKHQLNEDADAMRTSMDPSTDMDLTQPAEPPIADPQPSAEPPAGTSTDPHAGPHVDPDEFTVDPRRPAADPQRTTPIPVAEPGPPGSPAADPQRPARGSDADPQRDESPATPSAEGRPVAVDVDPLPELPDPNEQPPAGPRSAIRAWAKGRRQQQKRYDRAVKRQRRTVAAANRRQDVGHAGSRWSRVLATTSVVVTAIITTGFSAQGMYEVTARPAFHIAPDSPLRWALFAAFELAVMACAMFSRRSILLDGRPGVASVLVWIFAALSAITSASASTSDWVVRDVRLAMPFVAAALWELLLHEDKKTYHRRRGQTLPPSAAWVFLRERVLVRYGLMASQKATGELERGFQLARLAKVCVRYHRLQDAGAAKWRQRRARARLDRLSLTLAVRFGINQADRERVQDYLDMVYRIADGTSASTVKTRDFWATRT